MILTEKEKISNKFKTIDKTIIKPKIEKFQKNFFHKIFGFISKILGMIFRIILQIGEFYVCIVILNITFEYEIIYLCSTVSNNLPIHYFFSFTLGYFLVYPISMVFWELFKFNWIKSFFPFQTIVDLFKVIPKFGKFCKKDFNELNKRIEIKMEFTYGLSLILLMSYMITDKIAYEKALAYVILIPNLGKYAFIFFIYFIYSIITIINVYCMSVYNYIKDCCKREKIPSKITFFYFLFKTHDSYLIPLFTDDYEILDSLDPFILSMFYTMYIDITEDEKKEFENIIQREKEEEEEKENQIKSNVILKTLFNILLNLHRNYFIQHGFNKMSKKILNIIDKPMHKKCSITLIIKICLVVFYLGYSVCLHNLKGCLFLFLF